MGVDVLEQMYREGSRQIMENTLNAYLNEGKRYVKEGA